MSIARRTALRISSFVAAAGVLALSGCGSTGSATSHDAIVGDLTPEMYTLNERPIEHTDAMHITWNSNWRAMRGDIARAMLLDRPSRLAPVPITH